MTRAVAVAAVLLGAAGAAGCGSALEDVSRGGKVAGSTRSVYSLLQEPGRGAGLAGSRGCGCLIARWSCARLPAG